MIKYRRTRPADHWGGEVEFGGGKFGERDVRAVLNIPVVPGRLAAKIFEMHQESDGYYREIDTGSHRGGYNRTQNYGAAVLFTPMWRAWTRY